MALSQKLTADRQRFAADPQSLRQRRDLRISSIRSGSKPGSFERLGVFLDQIPEPQPCQTQKLGITRGTDRIADWSDFSEKDSGNEFAFRWCKKFKRIVVAILVDQDRSPLGARHGMIPVWGPRKNAGASHDSSAFPWASPGAKQYACRMDGSSLHGLFCLAMPRRCAAVSVI
ncbi:MAG TPA: hypothetical protein VKO85_04775 [Wenzhouxiangellaceae bacterium]|nr:hypothetical protein [Wenzhouxiangellaceae bacterium]